MSPGHGKTRLKHFANMRLTGGSLPPLRLAPWPPPSSDPSTSFVLPSHFSLPHNPNDSLSATFGVTTVEAGGLSAHSYFPRSAQITHLSCLQPPRDSLRARNDKTE